MICPNELEELGWGSHGSWVFALHAHSLGGTKSTIKRHSLVSGTVMVLQLVWVLVAFTVLSQGGGRSACCLQVSWERSEEESCRKIDTTCSCELWEHSYGLNVLERQKVQGHLGNSKPRKRNPKWMRQYRFQNSTCLVSCIQTSQSCWTSLQTPAGLLQKWISAPNKGQDV